MKIEIQIPDELAEQYAAAGAEANAGVAVPLAVVLQNHLEVTKRIKPGERVVVLQKDEREAIEQATNKLPLYTAEDLVARCRALASIKLGAVYLEFTPPQMRELVAKAERNRVKPEVFIEGAVRRLLEDQILSVHVRPGDMLAEAAKQAEPKAAQVAPTQAQAAQAARPGAGRARS